MTIACVSLMTSNERSFSHIAGNIIHILSLIAGDFRPVSNHGTPFGGEPMQRVETIKTEVLGTAATPAACDRSRGSIKIFLDAKRDSSPFSLFLVLHEKEKKRRAVYKKRKSNGDGVWWKGGGRRER